MIGLGIYIIGWVVCYYYEKRNGFATKRERIIISSIWPFYLMGLFFFKAMDKLITWSEKDT